VDSELEVIRDQMEETRASLADKLETLEAQVRDTGQSATETVASTVENVKETVASTVETVKDSVEGTVETVKSTVDSVTDTVSSAASALDPRPYVQNNPWAAVGAAVGVGFLGGLLAGGSSPSTAEPRQSHWTPGPSPGPSAAPASAGEESGILSAAKGLLSRDGPFGDVVGKVEGLAVGTLMGYLREMVSTSVPEMWKNDLTGALDNLTTRLGGKVIHHSDLAIKPREPHRSGGNGSSRHNRGWEAGQIERGDA